MGVFVSDGACRRVDRLVGVCNDCVGDFVCKFSVNG